MKAHERSGLCVAYSGVHQAYQLALAAHEEGVLQAFYCSIYNAPGKWGHHLSRVVGQKALASRKVEGFPPEKAVEYPWPLLMKGLRDKMKPHRANDWLTVNDAFDRWAARKLEKNPPKVVVGGETCDLHLLETAKRLGVIRVHDCPQLHPIFLEEVLREAGERAGMAVKFSPDLPGMAERKSREYELAEKLLIYSDVHRRSFLRGGFAEEKLFQCPLWVDPALWHRDEPVRLTDASQPLRLLFVGSINLRKGIPFLFEALKKCGKAVKLTLLGPRNPECEPLLREAGDSIEILGPQTKAELRQTYARHDVFVLPSVADSFGFVSLEAMACGLPAIVTENCGAPVPSPSWRVPPMNPEALAARILMYAENRALVAEHAAVAEGFAAQFGPETYRRNIHGLYQQLLPA
jgi:glycosyltransferase involved in cell wall biosynthesis